MITSLHSIGFEKSCRVRLSIVLGLAVACLCGVSDALAATLCVNPGGTSGCKSTITAAVGAASAGDTILVAPGTYKEDVVITKPVALLGSFRSSIIDASGLANGVFVNGMSAAPKIGISNVTILRLHSAKRQFRRILVANATDVSLAGNLVTDNNNGLDIATPSCAGISAFETRRS